MRFNSIAEFMAFTPKCPLCENPLATLFSSKGCPVPSYYRNIDLENITFYRYDQDKNITYSSKLVGENLNFNYNIESIGSRDNIIISVDINTGKISGEVDRVQKVFWDHGLSILTGCSNEECKLQGYMCRTVPLSLERKKCRVCPFQIEVEALHILINDRRYALSSTKGEDSTILVEGGNIIKVLPRMNLRAITGKNNILNKIKTILVFS